MGKLFGTDGIRGVANETLDCRLAYRVGQAAAISLTKKPGVKPSVVIGKDTRISSDMLEGALIAGLTASGCNVVRLGVIPTPGVAYLTVKLHADAGVVISASHNPFEHNGIKMFSGEGFKLSDALEEEIESLILREGELPVKTGAALGQVMDGAFTAEQYLDHLASTVGQLPRMRVLIDCANGAASATARKLFSRFALNVDYINDTPNGVNINNHCGSTHIEMLAEKVREGGYALGLAFDGDADRCLAVDENGGLIDGDQIMAICADTLTKQGKLTGSGFVATVMSNIGLHKYCDRTRPAAALRVGRRPERAGNDAARGYGPRRRAVRPHHFPGAYDDGRRPVGRASAAEHSGAVRQKGQRAGQRRHALSAGAPERPRRARNDEKTAIMESPLLRRGDPRRRRRASAAMAACWCARPARSRSSA